MINYVRHPEDRPEWGASNRRLLFLSYTTREPEVQRLKAILDPFLRSLPFYTWDRLGVWYDAVDIRHPSVDKRMRGGVVAWPDAADIPDDTELSDEQLAEELLAGLAACDFTLAMISPRYMQSRWCQFEWDNSKPVPGILRSCWKKARYLRNFATWTDPYRQPWLELYDRRPIDGARALLEAVIGHAECARRI